MSFISRLAPPLEINRQKDRYLHIITLPLQGEGDIVYLTIIQMFTLQQECVLKLFAGSDAMFSAGMHLYM